MRGKAIVYLLLTASLFSGALLPVLLGFGRNIGLYEFMFLISAFGLASSVLFVAVRGKTGRLVSIMSNPKMFSIALLAGLLSLLPLEFGIAYAEQSISASLATVIFRTSPLLMLILLPVILRERLSRYQILALALAFAGLYIGISRGNIISVNPADGPIIGFMAAMALGYALSTVLVKRYMFDIEVQLAAGGMAFFAFASVMFLAHGAVLQPIGIAGLALALYIGAVFNVYSFYIAFYALRRVKTTLYANVYFLSPFITFVLSYFLLGEAIEPYYIAIAAFVAAGILIQQFDRIGGTYMPKSSIAKNTRMFMFDVTGAFSETGETAINRQINSGGRVLAIKLPVSCKDSISNLMEQGVYTSDHPGIGRESAFLKDTIRMDGQEFLLMKVGSLEECEAFFHNVEKRVGAPVTK